MASFGNPYQSPQAESRPESESFPPRFLGCDAADFALTALVTTLLGGPLIAGAWGICSWLEADHRIGLIALLVVLCPVVLLGINRLTLEEAGIRVSRVFGSPRYIEWSHIRGIRKAARFEAARHTTFNVGRVCVLSSAYRDQVRIEWSGGYFYYPPRDLESFVAAFERLHGQRLDEQGDP